MAKKKERHIEKSYTSGQIVAKLRRLADCLEKGKPFQIQIAGERIYIPAGAIFTVGPSSSTPSQCLQAYLGRT